MNLTLFLYLLRLATCACLEDILFEHSPTISSWISPETAERLNEMETETWEIKQAIYNFIKAFETQKKVKNI